MGHLSESCAVVQAEDTDFMEKLTYFQENIQDHSVLESRLGTRKDHCDPVNTGNAFTVLVRKIRFF